MKKTGIDGLKERLDYEFEDFKDHKYQIPFEKSRCYPIYLNFIRKAIEEKRDADPVYFVWLESLFIFHLEYSVFAKVHLNNDEQYAYHSGLAMEYGFLILHYGTETCACFKPRSPFMVMNKAMFIFSQFVISENWERMDITGKYLVNSLNGTGCIIKNGNKNYHISWFLCLLYSKVGEIPITINPLFMPEDNDFSLYNEVINNWNTEDLKEVDRLVYLLAETHIQSAILGAKSLEDDDEHTVSQPEFFSPALYLFPYEILTWLSFRKKAGLKNPEKSTHPLMNYCLATSHVSTQNTSDLPYVKELLAQLKQKCPDVKSA